MNRRGFLRGALAAAVSSCVRWLPMPAAPRAVEEPLMLLKSDASDWVGLEPRYSDNPKSLVQLMQEAMARMPAPRPGGGYVVCMSAATYEAFRREIGPFSPIDDISERVELSPWE